MVGRVRGAASVLVAGEAFVAGDATGVQSLVAIAVSGLIGTVTFWGSLVAFGKLQGLISGNAVLFPGRHVINGLLGLASLTRRYCS